MSNDEIADLFNDGAVAMEALKLVTEIKRPLQVSVGNRDWTIDVPNKSIKLGKATNPELSITMAEQDMKNLLS